MLVNEQCEVYLQLGNYKEIIICDVMPMDVCHILVGRPWKYEKNSIHEGKRNIYKFQKDGLTTKFAAITRRRDSWKQWSKIFDDEGQIISAADGG